MNDENISVLICEPGKAAYTKKIKNDGDMIRDIIGGLMETHRPFWSAESPEAKAMLVICNEEGKLLDLPKNRVLADDDGDIYDILVGTFIICAVDEATGSFCSLSPSQKEIGLQQFGRAQEFKQVFDTIVVSEIA